MRLLEAAVRLCWCLLALHIILCDKEHMLQQDLERSLTFSLLRITLFTGGFEEVQQIGVKVGWWDKGSEVGLSHLIKGQLTGMAYINTSVEHNEPASLYNSINIGICLYWSYDYYTDCTTIH